MAKPHFSYSGALAESQKAPPGRCTWRRERRPTTKWSDAQARERRPLGSSPGGARHSPPKAGGGKDPQCGGAFPAGSPAFSVIRTVAWCTPFAALCAAVPTPTGRTGQRSAFQAGGAIWTVGVPARGCIFTATAQRSAQFSRWGLPYRRHHLDGGVPVRPGLSQHRAGSRCSLSDTPSRRSGSAPLA